MATISRTEATVPFNGTYVRTYVRTYACAYSKVLIQSPTYIRMYMSTETWYRKHFGNGVTYHCSRSIVQCVSSLLKWLTLLSKVCTSSAFSNWPGLSTSTKGARQPNQHPHINQNTLQAQEVPFRMKKAEQRFSLAAV